jgi:hypothetical protein
VWGKDNFVSITKGASGSTEGSMAPCTPHSCCLTKIVQGLPKLWANVRALIEIFSQSVGASLGIGANPVKILLLGEERHSDSSEHLGYIAP